MNQKTKSVIIAQILLEIREEIDELKEEVSELRDMNYNLRRHLNNTHEKLQEMIK